MSCFQKKKNVGNESSPLSEQRRSRVVLPLQEINRGKKVRKRRKITAQKTKKMKKSRKNRNLLKKKKNEPREEINELKIKQNNSSLPKKKTKN